jgi:tetratricopeptide (TPR) repeat protein
MWRLRHRYTLRHRSVAYGCLLLSGVICIALAHQQHRYTRLLSAGHRAVVAHRFDSQDYEQASRLWFADQELLLFNQGVLAYKAGHLPRATDLFRRASQHTQNLTLRTRALYNLSIVLLQLQEVQGAGELLKEALRLDPRDKEAKFALEQLYHIVHSQGEEHREAAGTQGNGRNQGGEETLKQAPGLGQGEGQRSTGDGQGRSPGRPGI